MVSSRGLPYRRAILAVRYGGRSAIQETAQATAQATVQKLFQFASIKAFFSFCSSHSSAAEERERGLEAGIRLSEHRHSRLHEDILLGELARLLRDIRVANPTI